MDKEKTIKRIVDLLQSASAAQRGLALTFVEHMTDSAGKDATHKGNGSSSRTVTQ